MEKYNFFNNLRRDYISGKIDIGDIGDVINFMKKEGIFLIKDNFWNEEYGDKWEDNIKSIKIYINKDNFYNQYRCKFEISGNGIDNIDDYVLYDMGAFLNEILAFADIGQLLESNWIIDCIEPKFYKKLNDLNIKITVNDEPLAPNKDICIF